MYLAAPLNIRPEQVFQLAQADNDGGRGGKAADDGFRQEVYQEPHLQQAKQQLDPPHKKGQEQRHGNVFFNTRKGKGAQPGGHQEGIHGHRPDGQLARGPHQGVNDLGHQGGIQPEHRGQACDHGVGHPLRDQHDADGQPRGKIP